MVHQSADGANGEMGERERMDGIGLGRFTAHLNSILQDGVRAQILDQERGQPCPRIAQKGARGQGCPRSELTLSPGLAKLD